MGKYAQYRREPVSQQQKWTIHPIWRGIGCIILVILPIIAFAAADVFITWNQKAHLLPLPPEMYQRIGLVAYTIPITNKLLSFNFGSLRLGDVLFTIIWFLLGLGIFTLVYSVFYRFMAPPRYVGYDSPPVKKYRKRTDQGKVGRRR